MAYPAPRTVPPDDVEPVLRDAGLPPIRFHDLRHTFATLQLAAGTNPKIVSEVLGHKEVAITLDRYSHALPTLQASAMTSAARRARKSPIRAWIGPKVASLVPHTGFPVNRLMRLSRVHGIRPRDA